MRLLSPKLATYKLKLAWSNATSAGLMTPTGLFSPRANLAGPRKVEITDYDKQGIFINVIDNLTERLIDNSSNKNIILSYGKFEREFFKNPNSSWDSVEKPFDIIAKLFHKFNPSTRPILWRILLVQANIYKAIIHNYNLRSNDVGSISESIFHRFSKAKPSDTQSKSDENFLAITIFSKTGLKMNFDWRNNDQKYRIPDEESVPHETMKKYFEEFFKTPPFFIGHPSDANSKMMMFNVVEDVEEGPLEQK